jgi:phosphate/sulfate permease
VGLVATLAIFVVVFVTFLVAPLVALLLAYLVYAVMRSRRGRAPSPGPGQTTGHATHGFGAGAQ